MELPKVSPEVPVRWPFRILAGLIVLAGLAAMIGTGLTGWSELDPSLNWQFLASLPAVVWLVRLAGYAAVRGKSRLRDIGRSRPIQYFFSTSLSGPS